MTQPSATVAPLFSAPTVRRTRRIEIYESDGTTLWEDNVPFVGGSVTVDYTRAERRAIDLELLNDDSRYTLDVEGLWYDKIIKPYAGLIYWDSITSRYQTWETQVGEFMIDNVSEDHFPRQVKITGRDYAKKCQLSKFTQPTTFSELTLLTTVIASIASNAGIPANKRILPPSPVVLTKDFPFEKGTTRWDAMKSLTDAYNFELFFDAAGNLVMRDYLDPSIAPTSFTFQTGPEGNLANFSRSANDNSLFNHIVVYGEGNDIVPVMAEAKLENPQHPARIAKIGDRLKEYTFNSVTDESQAQAIADRFLSVAALQEYEVNFGALLYPWLEVGEIIQFLAPGYQTPTEPTRFLMTNMSIPFGLGPMTGVGRRVTIIGALPPIATLPGGGSVASTGTGEYSEIYGGQHG